MNKIIIRKCKWLKKFLYLTERNWLTKSNLFPICFHSLNKKYINNSNNNNKHHVWNSRILIADNLNFLFKLLMKQLSLSQKVSLARILLMYHQSSKYNLFQIDKSSQMLNIIIYIQVGKINVIIKQKFVEVEQFIKELMITNKYNRKELLQQYCQHRSRNQLLILREFL